MILQPDFQTHFLKKPKNALALTTKKCTSQLSPAAKVWELKHRWSKSMGQIESQAVYSQNFLKRSWNRKIRIL